MWSKLYCAYEIGATQLLFHTFLNPVTGYSGILFFIHDFDKYIS